MSVNRGCVESARRPMGYGRAERNGLVASEQARFEEGNLARARLGVRGMPTRDGSHCRSLRWARYATYVLAGARDKYLRRDALPLRVCRGVIPFFGNC